jgi:hypothetical protein
MEGEDIFIQWQFLINGDVVKVDINSEGFGDKTKDIHIAVFPQDCGGITNDGRDTIPPKVLQLAIDIYNDFSSEG